MLARSPYALDDPQETLRPIETVYGEGYRFALAREGSGS